jgi:hypothetical protein
MKFASGTTNGAAAIRHLQLRNPKRLSITLPQMAYEQLVQQSSWEGRSMSNLAAFLLEQALNPGA